MNKLGYFFDIDNAGAVRWELKIESSTPKLYRNGILNKTNAGIATNPVFISYGTDYISNGGYGAAIVAVTDNFVIGEADHHVIGSLPTNWTIMRDLITPAATGVYAQNPTTGGWTSMNNNNFYIDACKEFLNPEDVIITNYATGTVINITRVTPIKNTITYPVTAFLNTPTALGTSIPDGMYSVNFAGSAVMEYFWVMSSGAVVTLNKVAYNLDETAVGTYTITPSYFDLATYSYALKVQDIYGATKSTQSIIVSSGAVSLPLMDTTYDTGAHYVVIEAIGIADGSKHIMAYTPITINDYLVFYGYVNNESAVPIVGANVSMVQAAALKTSNVLSDATGAYTSTGTFLTGTAIAINATKAGYGQYRYNVTPLDSKNIPLNITLISLTAAKQGLAINGIATETPYGKPIAGVNVSISNSTSTESYNAMTNNAGYYILDERNGAFLTYGRVYSVFGSKLRYSNSATFLKTVVGT